MTDLENLVSKYWNNNVKYMRKKNNGACTIDGLIKMCEENINNKMDGVEIGCWMGESTEVISSYCRKIWSVDPWDTVYGGYGNVYRGGKIDNNIKIRRTKEQMKVIEMLFDDRTKNISNITKIKNRHENIVNDFKDNTLDFVYIDALHFYDECKKDIKLWLPKIKKTGFISGHDYNEKDVKRAVNDTLNTKNIKVYSDFSWVVQLSE